MTRFSSWRVFGVVCFVLAGSLARAEDTKKDAKEDAPRAEAKLDQDALEKQFSERMSSTVLVGKFTVDGQPDKAEEERYEIESVTKLKGDYWTFLARVKYGTNDIKLPITVKVLWAGDTPMVSLTDLTIPGLGTFTSRVLFYEDRYAGTWQHGKVGGNLFGRIEKQKAEKPESKKDEAKPKAE